jgi:murein DD-endopeptidase MepM/ murein hydrolase activator NlpD
MGFSQDKFWFMIGGLGCSLALNIALIFDHTKTNESGTIESADVDLSEIPSDEEMIAQAQQEVHEDVAPSKSLQDIQSEWKIVRANVSHSLSRTFVNANPQHGSALSAVFSRLFMWDLDMRRDLMKGDQVEAVYRINDDGLPDIIAARYHSKKSSKTYSAFRYEAPGDTYASYWSMDGTEASLRLKNSPISEYEQVTSLLKDRPTHAGMDFKVPVGTETVTPKSGKVTRVNFGSMKYNGYCVEVKFSDGTLAKWLHLDKPMVKKGQQVGAQDVVGLTGNTGRSTAPHLHYQLDKGKRNLDPVDYHGTYRRRLSDTSMGGFLAEVSPYMQYLDGEGAMADR